MSGKLMLLISIMFDFCLGISSLEFGLQLTIQYDFMATCSSHSSHIFTLNNCDSTDALENCVSLAIPSEHRKQVLQGHTGLI